MPSLAHVARRLASPIPAGPLGDGIGAPVWRSRCGKPTVNVIGAGPGGLTSAMLLAARGFDVTVFEKGSRVGGRSAAIEQGGHKFDTGPSFLMMKFVLDEVFEEAGRSAEDYLDFVRLEPMYRLQFDDRRIEPTTEREAMLAALEANFIVTDCVGELFRGRRRVHVLAFVALAVRGARYDVEKAR